MAVLRLTRPIIEEKAAESKLSNTNDFEDGVSRAYYAAYYAAHAFSFLRVSKPDRIEAWPLWLAFIL